ncbi:GNAT family N-acetyltransferase [Actinocrispum wychmicini]|uniref:Putative acetyltransferase n=1 Tax=Actinocrispum wychmicini TaxID=1213861 RepID=A0A4R2J6E2_9PSEU|nr:GNAT family N-acetyltransferase [Actinocrispum wychmicini]TCO50735.1 putative acetyltransferase [Actinocrispum wychmicini]
MATSGRLGYEERVSELTVRLVTEDLFDEILLTFGSAFLRDLENLDPDWFRSDFEPDRFHGCFDGDELVGTAAVLTRDITLPGTGPTPVAGVTTVAVKPWHRRRGAASMLMHVQLHGLHEEQREPFAALWASEGSIYGRFGYGLAAHYSTIKVPGGVPFRAGVDLGKDRIRELPRAEAMKHVTAVYDRVAPTRVGWLSRAEPSWNMHLWDSERNRDGASAYRFAVHPDGYAIFRTTSKWDDRGPAGELKVREIVAASPVAAAALWRYLLDYDQVRLVNGMFAVDEPVTTMLHDKEQAVRLTKDGLWVRLVDVDRALALRGYGTPLDTVFQVTDVLCPWNQGRWRLAVDSAGAATVERTTADPDMVLDIADLGAAYLGGVRLTELAAAGLITELTPGAVTKASRAFIGDHAPHCQEVF